ncbi:MAG: PadR family transcriptional regulator [Thermomicrobiales bacterium]|nr:PadR family transcriptional regulator [Thermomicrobiales bacterium]
MVQRDAEKSRSTATWDERTLLLLGVLMTQNQHGYQINEFIENTLCHVATMKKPTAYALLSRLESAGFIEVHTEQAGNRPPRKVYTITPVGRDLFHDLLRANLSTADESTYAGDIGLVLINFLDRDEALACLRQRLERLDALLAPRPSVPVHGDKLNLAIALDHLTAMRRADRDWLVATIARLEHDEPIPAPEGSALPQR